MLALIPPTVELHQQWLEAHREWGPGAHEDGFGLDPSDDVESNSGFALWVERLERESDPWQESRGTCRWIVEHQQVLGGIALRHGTNDVTGSLGHIGYGVRPSARGRGIATWALGQMLVLAVGFGMERVLVVCAADNLPSRKTIEGHGGVPEELKQTDHGAVRRYWIELDT